MTELILGAATGLIFGALLQQGRVLRFEKQVGAMLLRDMTILKFMLSAIIVGMVGLHLLVDLEVVAFKVKSLNLAANLVGGALFGAGWAVMGYCPGTAFGAVGEGRYHAVWAVLGMLVGAGVYAELHQTLKGTFLASGAYGKVTVPGILGISPWVVIPIFVVGVVGLFTFFEKRKL